MPSQCDVFWARGASFDILATTVLRKIINANEQKSIFDFDSYFIYSSNGGRHYEFDFKESGVADSA